MNATMGPGPRAVWCRCGLYQTPSPFPECNNVQTQLLPHIPSGCPHNSAQFAFDWGVLHSFTPYVAGLRHLRAKTTLKCPKCGTTSGAAAADAATTLPLPRYRYTVGGFHRVLSRYADGEAYEEPLAYQESQGEEAEEAKGLHGHLRRPRQPALSTRHPPSPMMAGRIARAGLTRGTSQVPEFGAPLALELGQGPSLPSPDVDNLGSHEVRISSGFCQRLHLACVLAASIQHKKGTPPHLNPRSPRYKHTRIFAPPDTSTPESSYATDARLNTGPPSFHCCRCELLMPYPHCAATMGCCRIFLLPLLLGCCCHCCCCRAGYTTLRCCSPLPPSVAVYLPCNCRLYASG